MYSKKLYGCQIKKTSMSVGPFTQFLYLFYKSAFLLQADEDVVWCEDEGHQERHIFYCTPVPAETTWFRAISLELTRLSFSFFAFYSWFIQVFNIYIIISHYIFAIESKFYKSAISFNNIHKFISF